ncbi:MAG: hypothetical protein GY832_44265 [Chloroflexi bacterium]|nr:hypothetical protein [Chloroflexota bacterium]
MKGQSLEGTEIQRGLYWRLCGPGACGRLPTGDFPIHLVKAEEPWGYSFRAFGFPTGYDNGVWVSGRMLGRETTNWLTNSPNCRWRDSINAQEEICPQHLVQFK